MSDVLLKAAYVYGWMKDRCYREKNPKYKNYGGRGIKICKQWLDSPDDFILWYKERYFDGCQVDRIDVNGNYEPDNCRLVTQLVNSRNRTITQKLEAFGQIKTYGEWGEDSRSGNNVNGKVIYNRTRRGWSPEDAITRNKQLNAKTRFDPEYKGFGEIKTLQEWAIDPRCVVKKGTLWYRLKHGWDLEKALTKVTQ